MTRDRFDDIKRKREIHTDKQTKREEEQRKTN